MMTPEQARQKHGEGVSSGYFRLGGNKPGKLLAATAFTPFEVRTPGDLTHENPRAIALSPADLEPGPTKLDRKTALGMGYTGDQCDHCASMRMKIAGHCLICEECGTSTGCS